MKFALATMIGLWSCRDALYCGRAGEESMICWFARVDALPRWFLIYADALTG
jgi:hypothetical protein